MLAPGLVLARKLTFVLVLVARAASATPAAEKLFEDGRAALKLGHLDEACDAFRRSTELEPRVGTLLNLGECEERRGRVASAWEVFVEAKTLAAIQKDQRQASAEKRVAALATRLPYLVLAVKRGAGVQVTRDGAPVPAAEWDHEVPLDPKHYKLEASAAGHRAWTTEIDLAEGQHLAVEIPELVAEASEPASAVGQPATQVADRVVAPRAEPPGSVTTTLPATPPFGYRLGVGAVMGVTDRSELLIGLRVVANAAPLGPGWIRAVPVFRRWSGQFPNDVYRTFTTNELGATIEYALPINRWILVAAGAGLGIELQSDVNRNNATFYVPAARVSPTLHYPRFDISVSYELAHGPSPTTPGMYTELDRPAAFTHRFEVGLDFFVW